MLPSNRRQWQVVPPDRMNFIALAARPTASLSDQRAKVCENCGTFLSQACLWLPGFANGAGKTLEKISMAKENHTKAAEHHETAAKSHKSAASMHGKGDDKAAHAESGKAHASSEAAHKASTEAHGKSSAAAKK